MAGDIEVLHLALMVNGTPVTGVDAASKFWLLADAKAYAIMPRP
jgi:hypothetical protein